MVSCWPLNGQIGVIPSDRALEFGRIVICGFIKDICSFLEHEKPVSKARRNPHHKLVFRRQPAPQPLSEKWGVPAKIDSNVEDFSRNSTYKFSLRLRKLIMEAAKHSFMRVGMMVLHKLVGNPGRRKSSCIVALQKVAAMVLKHLRAQQEYIRDFSINNFQCSSSLHD